MDLAEYQRRAAETDQNPNPGSDESSSLEPARHQVIPLLGLVGEVGSLLGEYKKMLRDGATHRKFRDEVREELGDVLWYVANVATKFGLNLDEIATTNLCKVEERWHRPDTRRALYDHDLPENQRLPREFHYTFEHRIVGGVSKMVLVDYKDGHPTGDPVTDNAYEDDGYRFHDVIHLALAACLGWSPVLRKLLRSKGCLEHREPSKVDEVEDGGRAQVIEEAIVAAAYVYASEHNYLEGISAIDWQLLRHIKQMTSNVEVGNRTTKEWNDALLNGFSVWRSLRAHTGGAVRGNLLNGTLEFIPQQASPAGT